METFNKWRKSPFVVVPLLAVFGTLDLVLLGAQLGLGRSDWPAWVQAIGAIVAILVAVGVAAHQHSSAEDLRRADASQADVDYAELCLSIAVETRNCLADTRKKFEERLKSSSREIGWERYDQLLSSLQTVMAKPIPPVLIVEILVLQREIAFTKTAIREVGGKLTDQARVDKAKKREARALRCVSTIRAHLKACRAKQPAAR